MGRSSNPRSIKDLESFEDFKDEINVKYENIPNLCNKFNIKKNLIKPIYMS